MASTSLLQALYHGVFIGGWMGSYKGSMTAVSSFQRLM